jgi:hypothetical protein
MGKLFHQLPRLLPENRRLHIHERRSHPFLRIKKKYVRKNRNTTGSAKPQQASSFPAFCAIRAPQRTSQHLTSTLKMRYNGHSLISLLNIVQQLIIGLAAREKKVTKHHRFTSFSLPQRCCLENKERAKRCTPHGN